MKHTTLCLDFGNTRLKYAVFKNDERIETGVLNSNTLQDIQPIVDVFMPDYTILSSVIEHNQGMIEWLKKHTQLLVLNNLCKLPFTTPVSKPDTIGADRLALCAAAVHFYSNHHCLVIGLGTCITYNFIDKTAAFLGGSISPGMQMRFKAMHQQTVLLPMVTPQHDFPLIGYDTNTNLQTGVLLGMAKEIDGMIAAYQEHYHQLKVMMTGGDMHFFKHHIKSYIHTDDDLLFAGLLEISKANR